MTMFDSSQRVEFLSAAEILSIQNSALKRHLEYVSAKSPFYRQMFMDNGVDISKITVDSIAGIPCTDKRLVADFNDSFMAVPMSQIVDIVLSSGTTGKPVKVVYTERDLHRLAYNEEISFASCGLTKDDVVLLTCTIDRCFVAGLAYFSGIRSLGASAIRNGQGTLESHLEMIRRLTPTAIVGVPTFLLKLGQFIKAEGLDPSTTAVQKLICIGEPVRGKDLEFLAVGEKLEEIWGARVYSTYASSETITSFCECTAQQGGHLHPDLAVVEIVDEAGNPLPAGETGEVVVTPLAIEGMPLVRFKTGDVSFIIDEPCQCGRNSVRLGPILGRKNQMIKLRGTTLYPNSINALLDSFPGVGEYYVTVSTGYELSEIVKVFVSVTDSSCSAARISERLQAHLRVSPEVIIATEEEVKSRVYSANHRKLSRFFDERKSL